MSYSSEVLADTPLGYWRLGESSGTTAADSSGNGRNLTAGNPPTWGATSLLPSDAANTAADFNGTDDSIQDAASSTWMASLSAITVEAWITPQTVENNRVIASAHDSSTGNGNFILKIGTGGVVQFLRTRSVVITASGTTVLTPGNTYHVVGLWTGANARIYVNGVLEDGAGTGSGLVTGAAPINFHIGSTKNGAGAANFFDGVIDEVAIYGNYLSGERIAAHYSAGTTVVTPTGTISGVLPSLSANLAGGIEFSGAISASLPPLAAALAGETYPPGVAGDIVAALPPLSADLAGTSTAPVYSGTLAATLPALRATLAGQSFQPGLEGYIEALLPALSASLAGNAQGRVGLGLILDSSATVSADAPLDPLPTPTGAPATTQRIVATSVPVPTLVAGRPQ